MRVSFTMDFRNVTGQPWREFWEDRMWLMVQAEAMGFDCLTVQEHFFTSDGYGPSVPIFLTLLAERTKTARIGTYTYVLPLHHAAQMAQETAVLDHLSGGRLEVCVGAGHRPKEYAAWGLETKTRPSRMEEGLTVLKKAWTERPFTFQGKYYNLKDIYVAPEPLQKPHPPLWVAATAPAAAERAGRYGAGLHGSSVDPAFHEAYFRGLEMGGYKKSDARVSSPWSVTVTDEDPQKVWERNKKLYFQRWNFYSEIRSEMGDKELSYGLENQVGDPYRDNELIGSADVVLETLKGMTKKLPLTEIVHSGPAAGIPIREEAYPSLKRFAEKVLPELKKL